MLKYVGGYTPKSSPKPVKPPKKSTPSPPPQTRTQMLGGRSWTQHPITKNWTDQFGNRYSNGDFQNRLIQERKGTQASLAPSQPQSPSVAFAGNEIRKTDTRNIYGIIQTDVVFQEIITSNPIQTA